MDAAKRPQVLSFTKMQGIRAAFDEVWETIHEQDVFRPLASSDSELREQIMQRLLVLAADGTPPQEFTSKVLRSLPFH
jgi:hypothetical protein